MIIVHTEASCGWGGQEIRILEESRGMIERGHSVVVLCPGHSRIFVEAPRRGVPTIALPIGRKNLQGYLALRHWLKANRVDVINTHSSTDTWLSAVVCRTLLNAPPIVRTRHISSPIPRNLGSRWLYARAVAHVVTTGMALRLQVIEHTGAKEERVTSVPTGIDPLRFHPGDKLQARREVGIDPARSYIGVVATLRSWKGHMYLLEAFAKLQLPGWKLLIVGDGPQRQKIEAKVVELGIADRVLIVGQKDDPEIWLRAMDIFCLPSYANEGVPQALLQAMFTALPIVTTPVGAILEVATDGETALVVAPQDAVALTGALRRLVENPELGVSLGTKATAYAIANSSRDAMLDAMERIFVSTVGGR